MTAIISMYGHILLENHIEVIISDDVPLPLTNIYVESVTNICVESMVIT